MTVVSAAMTAAATHFSVQYGFPSCGSRRKLGFRFMARRKIGTVEPLSSSTSFLCVRIASMKPSQKSNFRMTRGAKLWHRISSTWAGKLPDFPDKLTLPILGIGLFVASKMSERGPYLICLVCLSSSFCSILASQPYSYYIY